MVGVTPRGEKAWADVQDSDFSNEDSAWVSPDDLLRPSEVLFSDARGEAPLSIPPQVAEGLADLESTRPSSGSGTSTHGNPKLMAQRSPPSHGMFSDLPVELPHSGCLKVKNSFVHDGEVADSDEEDLGRVRSEPAQSPRPIFSDAGDAGEVIREKACGEDGDVPSAYKSGKVRMPKAPDATVSQNLDHPLQIDLAYLPEHLERSSETASLECLVKLHSPVYNRRQMVGKVRWTRTFAETGLRVHFQAELWDETLQLLDYKRKPGQDEAVLLMQLLVAVFGSHKQVRTNKHDARWTTILDGYENCSTDTFVVVTFTPGLDSQGCGPLREIDVAHKAAFFLLSSVAGSRAWRLYGQKGAYLKLCATIAKSFHLNKPKKTPLNGSVPELLPGSILVARSFRNDLLKEERNRFHNEKVVVIGLCPRNLDEGALSHHCRVGTIPKDGEKPKIHRVHLGHLFTDGTNMWPADIRVPKYRVLLHRHGEDPKKVYLLCPEDGRCKVSHDPEGMQITYAEPHEIKFDKTIIAKSKQHAAPQKSGAASETPSSNVLLGSVALSASS